MRINLTNDEKELLEAQHQSERDKRVCDRIKAVLLKSEGWKDNQIAQALRMHVGTVRTHLSEYSMSKKLKPENKGSTSKLSEVQAKALGEHLEQHTYPTALEICQYVEKTFGVKYSVSGMTDWLGANEFSYKQPKEVPAKADVEKQLAFVEYYEKLMTETPEDEPILFGDSVHPTMATKVSYGWIKKGKDKQIASSASRTRVNICGAIELETMSLITQTYETVNSQSYTNFLSEVRSKYDPKVKIHCILDKASYHTSHETRDFAAKHNIKLHFLPPYSPNLNPIERVWKVMNEKVRNNKYFATPKEFRDKIDEFLNTTWSKISNKLIDRVNDSFNIIKPAI